MLTQIGMGWPVMPLNEEGGADSNMQQKISFNADM